MMVGLQGSGKTTTAAKLARRLKNEGRAVRLVAADVYRPAAIDQLETLGQQLDDSRVRRARTRRMSCGSRAHGIDEARRARDRVVIVDTAGRLQIDDEMMAELERLKDALHPDEILLVADGMTGQDAVRIAQGFDDRLGVTGVILTKMDGDARGGAALSIYGVTKKPIKYIGVGEKLDALEEFHPERMAGRILQMGDIVSLVEKAQGAFDADEAKRHGEEGPEGRNGPPGLPHGDEADPEAGAARGPPQTAARRQHEGAQAGEGRPQAHEAPRSDRPVDDAGGAQEARRSSTARAARASRRAPAGRSARSTSCSTSSGTCRR